MDATLENAKGDEGLMIEAFENGRRKGRSKALVKTSSVFHAGARSMRIFGGLDSGPTALIELPFTQESSQLLFYSRTRMVMVENICPYAMINSRT